MINLIKMAWWLGQLESGSQNQWDNQENFSVSQDLNDLQGQTTEYGVDNSNMEDEIMEAYENDPEFRFIKDSLNSLPTDPRKVQSWNPDVLNNLSK